MDHNLVGILSIPTLLGLMALGVPIGFAMFVVGTGGLFVLLPAKAVFSTLGHEPFGSIARYTMSTIPMFALMGYFAHYGGLTKDIFKTARTWVGKLPGGLAMASVAGCAGFAFCSGSSLASAAVMGKVAIPEMLRYGYDKRLASGTVAASGTLAAMIPPSITLILYGIITEQSISKILIAGIIPGGLSAIIYMGGIYLAVKLRPSLAPYASGFTWQERLSSLKGIWALLVLILLVLGGIYSGLFSPTEAGAAGAAGALILGVAARRINFRNFLEPVKETALMTSQIFIIIAGALMFARMLAISRMPYVFLSWVLDLQAPPTMILLGVMGMYIILGTFMEPLGMMFITLPIIFPVIKHLGFSPIWFGILLVKIIEIGVITPPVGMNVYALKSATPEIELEDIFKGAGMFLAMDILTLGLLISVPSITLWLPGFME